jgi:hypothetical protein
VEPVSKNAVAYWYTNQDGSGMPFFFENKRFLMRNPDIENNYTWSKDAEKNPFKKEKPKSKSYTN